MLEQQFIFDQVNKVTKRYKVSEEEARSYISQLLSAQPKLLEQIQNADSLESVERLADYKLFIKKAKKGIYYKLRQYHGKGDSAVKEHISTNEREPYINEFNEQIVKHNPNVRTVLDIGGGVYPLSFPFNRFPRLESYTWLEKDARAFQTLSKNLLKLENAKVTLFNESVGTHPWDHYLPANHLEFDLVLMLKLVSVLGRQQKHLVPLLTTVPAKTILVTSPKESMTKKESIEHRERKTLMAFVEITKRKIVGTLEIGNEFGYFLEF